MAQSIGSVTSSQTASLLRDLAWTIHRGVPTVAGVEPLPMTELAMLKHVLDSPGITVGELSRSLGLRANNTSAAVRSLTARGLVRRVADADDRRISHLFLTDRAHAEQAAISTAWVGPVHAALERLSPEEQRAISAAMAALQALNAALRAG